MVKEVLIANLAPTTSSETLSEKIEPLPLIPVCKECGATTFDAARETCLICLSHSVEMKPAPPFIKCTACGEVTMLIDGHYGKYAIPNVPYLNPKEATWYCGCEGWE